MCHKLRRKYIKIVTFSFNNSTGYFVNNLTQCQWNWQQNKTERKKNWRKKSEIGSIVDCMTAAMWTFVG